MCGRRQKNKRPEQREEKYSQELDDVRKRDEENWRERKFIFWPEQKAAAATWRRQKYIYKKRLFQFSQANKRANARRQQQQQRQRGSVEESSTFFKTRFFLLGLLSGVSDQFLIPPSSSCCYISPWTTRKLPRPPSISSRRISRRWNQARVHHLSPRSHLLRLKYTAVRQAQEKKIKWKKEKREDLNLSNHHQRLTWTERPLAIDCGRTQQLTSQLINLFSLYPYITTKHQLHRCPGLTIRRSHHHQSEERESELFPNQQWCFFSLEFGRLLIRQQRQLAICSILFLQESKTTDKILCCFSAKEKHFDFFSLARWVMMMMPMSIFLETTIRSCA